MNQVEQPTPTDTRIAAIDVGSNSLHMIIAQVDADGAATILWRIKEMVGLGRTSFPSHHLSPEAMDRAILALKRFRMLAVRRGCEKLVAVATSAVREAENGGDFIERARREAGVYVRVVSARDEARLIYMGVRHAMDFSAGPHLIIDIGGGSVELIVADHKQTLLLESRKLGAARMTAKFIKADPPKKKQIAQLVGHYREEMADILDPIRKAGVVRVVGTSGTMENLAAMCRGGRDFSEGKQSTLQRDDLDDLVEKLVKSEAADRVKIAGLDEKRQDQIIAGALLVHFLMHELEFKKIVLCDSALREGILLEYIGRHLPDLAIRRQVPDPRRRSVMDLARKCEWNETHSLQVAMITLKMFDKLADLHRLDSKARELVEYAAMLHDIGWHISAKAHHKHSAYLVKNGSLKGFTDREIDMIANMTRYHRRGMPKSSHKPYMSLASEDRKIVDVGAALLRIADGLDRSHSRVVRDLRCKVGRRRVKVVLSNRGDMELELWAARRKTDLFMHIFDRTITFRGAR